MNIMVLVIFDIEKTHRDVLFLFGKISMCYFYLWNQYNVFGLILKKTHGYLVFLFGKISMCYFYLDLAIFDVEKTHRDVLLLFGKIIYHWFYFLFLFNILFHIIINDLSITLFITSEKQCWNFACGCKLCLCTE